MHLLSVAICFFVFSTSTTAQSGYQLKETGSSGSCSNYQIVDENGSIPSLPFEVLQALQCPVMLHLKGDTITFLSSSGPSLHIISQAKTMLLVSGYPDADGVSGPAWSPSGKRVAFVFLSQNRTLGFRYACRIVIVELDQQAKPFKIMYFDRPVQYVCGSICGSDAGSDFFFVDENNFVYRRHEMDSVRPGCFGYIGLPELNPANE